MKGRVAPIHVVNCIRKSLQGQIWWGNLPLVQHTTANLNFVLLRALKVRYSHNKNLPLDRRYNDQQTQSQEGRNLVKC